jgi:hypothetical protein
VNFRKKELKLLKILFSKQDSRKIRKITYKNNFWRPRGYLGFKKRYIIPEYISCLYYVRTGVSLPIRI